MVPELFGLALLTASAGATDISEAARSSAKGLIADVQALARKTVSLQAAVSGVLAAKATFRPADRSVSNWRDEATRNLDSTPGTFMLRDEGAPSNMPRCVRLNNYWCVKRAGWAGEIASDAEGHVAFGSAMEGAIVAAMLLRRYYVAYNLRSAKAILSRWAPAQCGPPQVNRALAGALPAPTAARMRNLSTRGLNNTLRGRWLAAHRPQPASSAGAPARKEGMIIAASTRSASIAAAPPVPTPRRSTIPNRTVRLMRAPEIAVGMGERAVASASLRIDFFVAPQPAFQRPTAYCPDEIQRIRNYASRAIEGFASSPDEDLRLFSADGTPGANLPLFLRNMASVEIGPLSAKIEMIGEAVALEAARTLALRAAAVATPAAP